MGTGGVRWYRVPLAVRLLAAAGGSVYSYLGLVFVRHAVVVNPRPDETAWWFTLIIMSTNAVIGLLFVRVVFTPALGLADGGIYSHWLTDPIPWSDLAAVRDRPLVSRLDLLSADGRVIGRLSYFALGSQTAVERIVSNLPARADPPVRAFRVPARVWMATAARLVTTFSLTWLVISAVLTGPSVMSLVLTAAWHGASRLRRKITADIVVVDDEFLLVRYGWGDLMYAWADIVAVELVAPTVPFGAKTSEDFRLTLHVRIRTAGGELPLSRLPGVDTAELYRAIRDVWRQYGARTGPACPS